MTLFSCERKVTELCFLQLMKRAIIKLYSRDQEEVYHHFLRRSNTEWSRAGPGVLEDGHQPFVPFSYTNPSKDRLLYCTKEIPRRLAGPRVIKEFTSRSLYRVLTVLYEWKRSEYTDRLLRNTTYVHRTTRPILIWETVGHGSGLELV